MDKNAIALELRDIHIGEASIWPLALGWWILIVIVLISFYFIIKKLIVINQQKRTNTLLQKQLLLIRNDYKKHKSKPQFAADVSQLLKRFVRHIQGDLNASVMTGDNWINYLNKKAGSSVFNQFSQELTQAQYKRQADFDVSKLYATVKNFFPIAIKLKDKVINKSINKPSYKFFVKKIKEDK